MSNVKMISVLWVKDEITTFVQSLTSLAIVKMRWLFFCRWPQWRRTNKYELLTNEINTIAEEKYESIMCSIGWSTGRSSSIDFQTNEKRWNSLFFVEYQRTIGFNCTRSNIYKLLKLLEMVPKKTFEHLLSWFDIQSILFANFTIDSWKSSMALCRIVNDARNYLCCSLS